MAFFLLKQSVKSQNYKYTNKIGEIDSGDLDKLMSVFVGEMTAFEFKDITLGSKVPMSQNLNTQVLSAGKVDKWGTYTRQAFAFQDVKQGESIKTIRDIKSSFHCHKNVDEPAEYINLIKDKIHSTKLL